MKLVMELLIMYKHKGTVKFIDFGGYQQRNKSMKKIFSEALNNNKIPDFQPVIINTGDRPFNKRVNYYTYSFSTSEGYFDKVIPDFIYDKREEANIPDFELITKTLTTAGDLPPYCNKLGWIGSFGVISARNRLGEIGKENNNIMDIKNSEVKGFKFISLEDQVKRYKYLIDVEGLGYSGRLKLLFFSNRCLFIQTRQRQDYPLLFAKPYFDYIPVKQDLSDLVEQLKKIQSNPELEKKIQNNCKQFCQEYLDRKLAYKYIQNLFLNMERHHLRIFNCCILILIKFILRIADVIKLLLRFNGK